MILLFVGISGFEPELEEPKSSVLPLHHIPIKPPTFAGERKEKITERIDSNKIKNLCPKNLEIHSTKNIKKYHPPHPHGLSDGATKNLNLLQLCIIKVNEISIKNLLPSQARGKNKT